MCRVCEKIIISIENSIKQKEKKRKLVWTTATVSVGVAPRGWPNKSNWGSNVTIYVHYLI